LKYNKKDDPTASTIDADKFINDEFKKYVDNSNILQVLDLKIKMIPMENLLNFESRIHTITDKEMHEMIDKEIEQVHELIKERITWQTGMCMIEDNAEL
jgi:hypothetical protein